MSFKGLVLTNAFKHPKTVSMLNYCIEYTVQFNREIFFRTFYNYASNEYSFSQLVDGSANSVMVSDNVERPDQNSLRLIDWHTHPINTKEDPLDSLLSPFGLEFSINDILKLYESSCTVSFMARRWTQNNEHQQHILEGIVSPISILIRPNSADASLNYFQFCKHPTPYQEGLSTGKYRRIIDDERSLKNHYNGYNPTTFEFYGINEIISDLAKTKILDKI